MQRLAPVPHVMLWALVALACSGMINLQAVATAEEQQIFQAGAASVDISPVTLPALRNGGFIQASSDRVDDPLHARCLVLSDGRETIAMVIVDSCMFPRTLCDEIKRLAGAETGIRHDRILISATHTHSAPAAEAFCLGCGRDEAYVKYVPARVAAAITAAHGRLQPAKIGWATEDGSDLTNCRRWITRSDRMGTDPFGQRTVRAMMHPGYQNPDYVSPAGPIDPWLSVVSVVSQDNETPICILANLSMHYFGAGRGFSADYYGEVARGLESRIEELGGRSAEGFVGVMSQGTSGDLHWMDYSQPPTSITRQQYSTAVTERIAKAWKSIEHRSGVELAMAEKRVTVGRRLPDRARLEWSRPINLARGDQPPRDRREVYAQQVKWIDEHPTEEVVLQAIRIGQLGITAIPNEVYGITGLKLKRQSPLRTTFNLELANGGAGYIPPPEQHRLGGYTTWPARSAGLAVEAEPLIVETLLQLLESVADARRTPLEDPDCPWSNAQTRARPVAYWRLDDIASNQIKDSIGEQHGSFHGGVALYLPGPDNAGFTATGYGNRCVYLAGGRLELTPPRCRDDWTISLWFWNGLPTDARAVTGTLLKTDSLHLEIAGTENKSDAGGLVLTSKAVSVLGKSRVAAKQWHHLAVSSDQRGTVVYLDGRPAIEGGQTIALGERLVIGGDAARAVPFDGKVDEVAVFDRSLTADAMAELFRQAGVKSEIE